MDIHRKTAAQVFGIPYDEVDAGHRRRAKAINFGIVYGISAWSLADDIHVSSKEAQQYIDAYLERYHGVRDYMKNIVASAREKGWAAVSSRMSS